MMRGSTVREAMRGWYGCCIGGDELLRRTCAQNAGEQDTILSSLLSLSQDRLERTASLQERRKGQEEMRRRKELEKEAATCLAAPIVRVVPASSSSSCETTMRDNAMLAEVVRFVFRWLCMDWQPTHKEAPPPSQLPTSAPASSPPSSSSSSSSASPSSPSSSSSSSPPDSSSPPQPSSSSSSSAGSPPLSPSCSRPSSSSPPRSSSSYEASSRKHPAPAPSHEPPWSAKTDPSQQLSVLLLNTVTACHRVLSYLRLESLLLPTVIYAERYAKTLGRLGLVQIFDLLLISTVVAIKYWSDSPVSNQAIATLFSIPLRQINQNEVKFLKVIGYDLNLTQEEISMFERRLHRP